MPPTTRTTVRLLAATLVAGAGIALVTAIRAPEVSDGAGTTSTPGTETPSIPAVMAQEAGPEDPVAAWEAARSRALDASAAVYGKLAAWCEGRKLAATALVVRRLVLRYRPDDAETRSVLGWTRAADGTWVQCEARRAALREVSDIEDPRAMKFPEKLAGADMRVVGVWRSLALKATKNGEIDSANAAKWTDRAAHAWGRVLEADASDEAAHKALGHPKFDGRYVQPGSLAVLRVRAAREASGRRIAATSYATTATAPTGALHTAGLEASAARSEHFVVETVHGKEDAVRRLQWAERAMSDFRETYGVGADVVLHLPWDRFGIVRDGDELARVFPAVGGLGPAGGARRSVSGGTAVVVGREWVGAASPGGAADQAVIHATSHALAAALRTAAIHNLGDPGEGVEDWLVEAIADDVERCLAGRNPSQVHAFTQSVDLPPSSGDPWIDLARRAAEADDDVPLSRLWRCSLANQDLRGPETVKGWALLQFLFESDPAKARAFVRRALAQGTPKAVAAVYGVPLDEIDARYRAWLRDSW